MDKQDQHTTAERLVSKTRTEVINEAQRIEESLLYTSKGHFASAHFWTNFHLWIGIPVVVLSAVAGATALSQIDPKHLAAGIISIIVAALSAVMTFLDPNKIAATHLNAGNLYDSLMNKTRIFWSIDCWRDHSDEILTDRLKILSDEKDKLNQRCPQVPRWAYKIAKHGIKEGEGGYMVDKE